MSSQVPLVHGDGGKYSHARVTRRSDILGERTVRTTIVILWTAWSALLAGGFIYTGAGTPAFAAKWPQAAGMGAGMGLAAALLITRAWGARRGMLLGGMAFGVVAAALV